MDTAPAYGNSEEKIGQLNNPNFSYITKIPSLKNYPLLEDKIRAINYSVNNSLSNLGTDLLFCILFQTFYLIYFLIKTWAIWTVFKAAPLSKLSETTHKLIAFELELSFLILEIKVV